MRKYAPFLTVPEAIIDRSITDDEFIVYASILKREGRGISVRFLAKRLERRWSNILHDLDSLQEKGRIKMQKPHGDERRDHKPTYLLSITRNRLHQGAKYLHLPHEVIHAYPKTRRSTKLRIHLFQMLWDFEHGKGWPEYDRVPELPAKLVSEQLEVPVKAVKDTYAIQKANGWLRQMEGTVEPPRRIRLPGNYRRTIHGANQGHIDHIHELLMPLTEKQVAAAVLKASPDGRSIDARTFIEELQKLAKREDAPVVPLRKNITQQHEDPIYGAYSA